MSIVGDRKGVSIRPAFTMRRAYDRFVMNASNWRVCGLETAMCNPTITLRHDLQEHDRGAAGGVGQARTCRAGEGVRNSPPVMFFAAPQWGRWPPGPA
ncbi:hypothetical protein GCM10023238_38020 [Streptomyces heliomycini]